MTSLHGATNDFDITMPDRSVKHAQILMQWYQSNVIDIALLLLSDRETPFDNWLPILRRSVSLEPISVLSMEASLKEGGTIFSRQKANIHAIEPELYLCRAFYYAAEGCSGAAIVTSVLPDGNVSLIGVHVASQDATKEAPDISCLVDGSSDHASAVASSNTHSSNIHGHSAYQIICIANAVPELISLIEKDLNGEAIGKKTPTAKRVNSKKGKKV